MTLTTRLCIGKNLVIQQYVSQYRGSDTIYHDILRYHCDNSVYGYFLTQLADNKCEKKNPTKTQDDTDLKTFDPCCDRRLHHSIDVHVTFIAVEGKQRQYFIVKFLSLSGVVGTKKPTTEVQHLSGEVTSSSLTICPCPEPPPSGPLHQCRL